MFTVAVVGRPNVGKSTLFNRLTGSKHALVHNLPGVTRDRREGDAKIADLKFKIVDTAGLEESDKQALETRMMQQTSIGVDQADACLMLLDGRAGITPDDRFFATWLRKKNKPVVIVINKCEGNYGEETFHEALSMGFKHVVMISAEHGEGMGELYMALDEYKQQSEQQYGELEVTTSANEKAIQIAILGRPNTGKSTLLNCLLGAERSLTGPEAGITRDSIATDWQFEGVKLRLIDTAGIRRKANVKEKLEKLSVGDSLRALRFAHVAILMIDATALLEKQDLAIAELIIREGRAVVIGANKWDLVEDKEKWLDELHYTIEQLLPQIKGVSVVTLSALQGDNVTQLMQASLAAYKVWNTRLSTSPLNEWLKSAEGHHLPPLGKNNRRVRLKYITQGNTRPPTFTLFVNRPQDLPDSYVRYLINALRGKFALGGVPMRMMLRASDNPYVSSKK